MSEDDIERLVDQQNEIANRIAEEDSIARDQKNDHAIIVGLRSKLAAKDAEIERLHADVARKDEALRNLMQEIVITYGGPSPYLDRTWKPAETALSPAKNFLNDVKAGA